MVSLPDTSSERFAQVAEATWLPPDMTSDGWPVLHGAAQTKLAEIHDCVDNTHDSGAQTGVRSPGLQMCSQAHLWSGPRPDKDLTSACGHSP